MTSIVIRAGWQIQQIGQVTPKEIKKKKNGVTSPGIYNKFV